ncbi:MAG TPA: hypothetical protein VGE59_00880 [Patescibacteria group bacterium]
MSKRIIHFTIAITGLIFVATSLLGLASSMQMASDTKEHTCLLMPTEPNCDMTIAEHISLWQSTFTSVASSIFTPLLILLFITVVGTITFFLTRDKDSKPPGFWRDDPESNLFNNLVRAFAQGLIHPKIYPSLTA